jgi:hypothetical protein
LTLDSLTLEQLRAHRPDLIREVEDAYETQLQEVQSRLDEMIAREEASRRRERIFQLLEEHNLPLPASNGSLDSRLVGSQFIESLMQAADDKIVRRLIEERAELVRAACRWNGKPDAIDRRPRSRDQVELASVSNGRPVRSAAEFAAAVRGR